MGSDRVTRIERQTALIHLRLEHGPDGPCSDGELERYVRRLAHAAFNRAVDRKSIRADTRPSRDDWHAFWRALRGLVTDQTVGHWTDVFEVAFAGHRDAFLYGRGV